MWPLVFGANGLQLRGRYPWRPFLDYFELLAALIGLICCAAAPFFTNFRLGLKWALVGGALLAYAADLILSAILGMIIFGIPMD